MDPSYPSYPSSYPSYPTTAPIYPNVADLPDLQGVPEIPYDGSQSYYMPSPEFAAPPSSFQPTVQPSSGGIIDWMMDIFFKQWKVLAIGLALIIFFAIWYNRRKLSSSSTSSSASSKISSSQSLDPPKIAHYVKDYASMYNNDFVYVDAEGKPIFRWHNTRFDRPDITKPDGIVHTFVGGIKPAKLKWIDNPTIDDLTIKFGKTIYKTTGDLAAKSEKGYMYVFRKDKNGNVQVMDSINFATNPPTENNYSLARLSNPQP